MMSFPLKSPHDCFICLSPYWHRNLHDDRTLDKFKLISSYELDVLPVLWRNVLFKNAHFCEHVCHSWLSRSQRSMEISSNGVYKPEPTDCDLVRKEAMRLEEMLDGLITGIRKRGQLIDSQDYLLVFTQMSLGKKQRVTWQSSKGKKIIGSWYGLAEALIEQYSSNIELDDVHEREMRIIIWKHFIMAIVQHLIEYSSASSRSLARRLLPPRRTSLSTSLNNNSLNSLQSRSITNFDNEFS